MMASFLGAGMQDTLVRLGMHSIFQVAAWGPVGTDTVLVTGYIYSSHNEKVLAARWNWLTCACRHRGV